MHFRHLLIVSFLQARRCFAEIVAMVFLDGPVRQSSPGLFQIVYLFCSVLQPGTLPVFCHQAIFTAQTD